MTDTQQPAPEDDSPTARAIQAVMDDARRPLEKRVAELEAELDEVTDLDRSALKTQEIRDERDRAVRRWHKEKKRADQAEAELGRLRQSIVDADSEAAAESIRADVAEAQRDQARRIARHAYRNWLTPRVRSLAENNSEFSNNTAEALGVDALPDWLTSELRAAPRPLAPGLPGYACARCGSLFTPSGEPRDEHSRHADSPYCRSCVDQCHEAGDGHCCAICTPGGAR